MADKLWVENRHPDYEKARRRREFAWDHYTAECVDAALEEAAIISGGDRGVQTQVIKVSAGDPGTSYEVPKANLPYGRYLLRRTQGESGAGFYERVRVTRYANHMATLTDSFIGGVLTVETNAKRKYGAPLGDPSSPTSVAYRLFRDFDGTGTDITTRVMRDATEMVVKGSVVYLADLPPGGELLIKRIDPDALVNWRLEDGVMVEALLEENVLESKSLKDEATEQTYYVHYTIDGWTRYRVEEDELIVVNGSEWAFPIFTSPERTVRRLPIGRIDLPVARPVGYQMARDANLLWNLFSDTRWLIRVLNHPRLRGKVLDDEWNTSMQAILAGFNGLQGDWDYISPDAANANAGYAMYRDEVRDYYISNHQRANQSAIERSATEILYNEAAGRTAFLSMIANSIDRMENEWMFMASQLLAPTKPE